MTTINQNLEKRTPVGKATLLDDNRWVIEASPEAILMIKRILPRCNDTIPGKIFVKDNMQTARDLHWISMRYPLEFFSPEPIEEKALAFDLHLEKLEKLLKSGATKNYPLALPAREYQKIAAELLTKQGHLLLADEIGTGKTVSSLSALTQPELRPAIVVCPSHLCIQWKQFAKKFLPKVGSEIAKTGKPHKLKENTEILIISYAKLKGWAHHLHQESNRPKTIIFDEIQELRRPESQKYKAAQGLTKVIPYRLGNSASPVTNYGGEVYHILEILAPGYLGTENEFKREWCSHSRQTNKWIIRHPEALGSHLRKEFLVLRRTRKDVQRELPPDITTVHTVPFDPYILKNAEESSLELARILLEGTFTEQGQAARELDMKLRQATGLAKSQFTAEFARMFLEEKTPLILCGWHRACYEVWKTLLHEFNPVFCTGHESAKEKEISKDKFISGESNLFIMSLRSGLGIDGLQHRCSTILFGELDWSKSFHDQCRGRILRDGQKDTVSTIYLVADGGSDPIVSQILGIKSEQARGITDPFLDPDQEIPDELIKEREIQRLKLLATHILKKHGKLKEGLNPPL